MMRRNEGRRRRRERGRGNESGEVWDQGFQGRGVKHSFLVDSRNLTCLNISCPPESLLVVPVVHRSAMQSDLLHSD